MGGEGGGGRNGGDGDDCDEAGHNDGGVAVTEVDAIIGR